MHIQETKMKMKTRETDDGRVLKEGVLFRSGRVCFSSIVTIRKKKLTRRKKLDDASEHDKRRLFDEYHISTVLDLRSKYAPYLFYIHT